MSHPYRPEIQAIRRTTWSDRTRNVRFDGYNTTQEVRVRDPDGPLVASLTENNLHAPALDVDFSAQVQRREGRDWLLLDGPSPVYLLEWRELLRALVRSGLLSPETAAGEMEIATIMAKELVWQGGRAMPGSQIELMPPLPFDVPVIARPSTTPGHFHVYVEKEMSWDAYAELLQALCDTGIIERGYRKASLERGMTMLYRPGYPNPKKKSFFRRIFA